MTREEVFEVLTEIFEDTFDEEDLELTDATCADDIEAWDSLEHINLIFAIEQHYHIKFAMDEVNSFKNVGQLVDAVLAKA